MKVMGCDIGGTNVRIRVVQYTADGARTLVAEQHFRSSEYAGLESVLATFLSSQGLQGFEIHYACVAVAGPVQRYGSQQRSRLTNLPWVVDNKALSQALGVPRVELLNDFEAVGYGLDTLDGEDILTLQAGEPLARAPRALIGAGTGLGQALLVWDREGYYVIATEGGHVDFAPGDALQTALLQDLRSNMDHVSFEDVLSGPGLERIYRFLQGTRQSGAGSEPGLDAQEDAAAAIGAAAVAGTDGLSMEAVQLFLSIYGAQAGNLALTSMARGGVYIAGGIAPKLSTLFADSDFLRAFHHKGRMSPLMARFPVHLVRNADVGLRGAVQLARRRLAETTASKA